MTACLYVRKQYRDTDKSSGLRQSYNALLFSQTNLGLAAGFRHCRIRMSSLSKQPQYYNTEFPETKKFKTLRKSFTFQEIHFLFFCLVAKSETDRNHPPTVYTCWSNLTKGRMMFHCQMASCISTQYNCSFLKKQIRDFCSYLLLPEGKPCSESNNEGKVCNVIWSGEMNCMYLHNRFPSSIVCCDNTSSIKKSDV